MTRKWTQVYAIYYTSQLFLVSYVAFDLSCELDKITSKIFISKMIFLILSLNTADKNKSICDHNSVMLEVLVESLHDILNL